MLNFWPLKGSSICGPHTASVNCALSPTSHTLSDWVSLSTPLNLLMPGISSVINQKAKSQLRQSKARKNKWLKSKTKAAGLSWQSPQTPQSHNKEHFGFDWNVFFFWLSCSVPWWRDESAATVWVDCSIAGWVQGEMRAEGYANCQSIEQKQLKVDLPDDDCLKVQKCQELK